MNSHETTTENTRTYAYDAKLQAEREQRQYDFFILIYALLVLAIVFIAGMLMGFIVWGFD